MRVGVLLTQQVTLDPDKTAVIVMDFQNCIVNESTFNPQEVVQKAAQVLQGARQAGIPIIHVVHNRWPDEDVSRDTEIHPGTAPAAGEQVISKTSTSPFSTTGLDVTLREMGRDTLVLLGVATSGCVLSTVRWAADIPYKLAVVSDACSDPDPEVHRVLTEKVYPNQASVLTAQEFLEATGVA